MIPFDASLPTPTPAARLRLRSAGAAALLLLLPARAPAHDFRLGAIVIDHPYATPTLPGARSGAVYLRALKNRGAQADRLVAARTPVAATVEMHRSSMDGDVVRMRAVSAIELPAGSALTLRHGGDTHLMLVDLKAPLQDGQRFPLWLRFEHAGEREVTVWVQTPRDRGGHRH